MNNISLLVTEDGSHTLLNTALNEQYHSKHGAIQESKHVFIQMGFDKLPVEKKSISILEIGFGTGLNAYLTLLKNLQQHKSIHYTAIEAYPIEPAAALKLNYPELLVNKSSDALFEQLHTCPWNEECSITPEFRLIKYHSLLQEVEFNTGFDLIYFDAFSPNSQPELWSLEIFSKLYSMLHAGGFLVTYCAKGEVKRNLKKAGFKVIELPGPPGKREMTAAYKD